MSQNFDDDPNLHSRRSKALRVEAYHLCVQMLQRRLSLVDAFDGKQGRPEVMKSVELIKKTILEDQNLKVDDKEALGDRLREFGKTTKNLDP